MCLFCKIVNKELGDKQPYFIYEDKYCVAFKDINPRAAYHILVVPKKHICCISDLDEENYEISGRICLAIAKIAKQESIAADGYRVVINNGENAGQVIFHLHFHVLAGEKLEF